MTSVSQPQLSVHSEPTIVPASKPLTTSPITLKPPPTKAPSKTVKMFFPGDDDDDDTLASTVGPDTGSKVANLVPPVKDKDATTASMPDPSRPAEFLAARAFPTATMPPGAPLAHYKANGTTTNSTVPIVSVSPKTTTVPPVPSQVPLTPNLTRAIREETSRSATDNPLTCPGPMPPPASARLPTGSTTGSSPTNAINTGGTTTPITLAVQTSPAFVPENKVLRAVASSSNPRRPDRAPSKVPKTASEYQIICQVGEGTFGKVYKARSLANPDTLVALKRIRMEGEKDGFPVTAMREIKLLQSLRHENVINLHEMMVSKGTHLVLITLF
jgi:hypothetical protein